MWPRWRLNLPWKSLFTSYPRRLQGAIIKLLNVYFWYFLQPFLTLIIFGQDMCVAMLYLLHFSPGPTGMGKHISSLITLPYILNVFPSNLPARSYWLFGVTWHLVMELFTAKSLIAKSVTSLDNSCTVTSDSVFLLDPLMSLLSCITNHLISSPSGNQLPSNLT